MMMMLMSYEEVHALLLRLCTYYAFGDFLLNRTELHGHLPPLSKFIEDYVPHSSYYYERILGSFVIFLADIISSRLISSIVHQASHRLGSYWNTYSFWDSSTTASVCSKCYLFCPWTILSAAGISVSNLNNFMLLISVDLSLKGRTLWTILSVCLSSTISFYSISLLPILIILSVTRERRPVSSDTAPFVILISYSLIYVILIRKIVFSSKSHKGSWIPSYWWDSILSMKNLTPNIGLYWYVMMILTNPWRDMYRSLFILYSFIFVLPITWNYKSEPMRGLIVIFILQAILRTYPTLNDLALPLCFLPLYSMSFDLFKTSMISLWFFISSSLLFPILWFLWHDTLSGNLSYYYAASLMYNLAAILLVLDLLRAFVHMKNHPDQRKFLSGSSEM